MLGQFIVLVVNVSYCLRFCSQTRENGQKLGNKFTPFWTKFVQIAKNGAISLILSDSNSGK